jgi:regulator of cell morphogenesis and NO signaling
MDLDKRKLNDLVEENYVYASVLFYFGIEFYDYSEQTLGQVCKSKGLKLDVVTNTLESIIRRPVDQDLQLMSLPIDLVIAYLKHKHFTFIKQTLPYLAKLIDNYPSGTRCDIINDIKLVFPLFAEDYIYHMYEEEDHAFKYILMLDRALKGKNNSSDLYYVMEKNSIAQIASEHNDSDDVMRGIRKITNNYALDEQAPVLLKVIYAELQAFEKNLIIHARIENEVLLPKALMLEKQVKNLFQKQLRLN